MLFHRVLDHLLVDGPRVGRELMRLLPRTERLPARQMLAEIAVQVGGYMRRQLLTSLLALPVAAALPVVLRFTGKWRAREAELSDRLAAVDPAAKPA